MANYRVNSNVGNVMDEKFTKQWELYKEKLILLKQEYQL